MTAPQLVDASGQQVLLDARPSQTGGEGALYTMPSVPGFVAKVWLQPPTREKADKLAAMIAMGHPKLRDVTAWPIGLLFDRGTRRLVGFTMTRLVDYRDIWQLYSPSERLKFFPRAGWAFQLRAAQNLAAAFDEVHRTGCVVGDVQLKNAFVSAQAFIRLIDCDSFQFTDGDRTYHCDVALPEYTPPELQGKHLKSLTRTANHDCFGLAVLIYQLLFVGRHPYAGRYTGPGDPDLGQIIAGYRFSQGPLAHTWGMGPPPFCPTYEDIPPAVGMLFRRAFERGGESGKRPTAAEWLPVLKRLEQNTATCTVDPGHQYWSGASGCVWCRLASNDGPEYYYGVSGGDASFTIDESKLRDIQRRLAAAAFTDFQYARTMFLTQRQFIAKPLLNDIAALQSQRESLKEMQRSATLVAQMQEATDDQRRQKEIEKLRAKLTRNLRDEKSELETELREATIIARAAERDGQWVSRVLFATTILGGLLSLFGCYRWYFGVVGGAVLIIFGACCALQYWISKHSPSRKAVRDIRKRIRLAEAYVEEMLQDGELRAAQERQQAAAASRAVHQQAEERIRQVELQIQGRAEGEKERRQANFRNAEEAVVVLERQWSRLRSEYSQKHSHASAEITSKVSACRALTTQHGIEFQHLTTLSKQTARIRHLRLHSLSDANIHGIGEGLKNTLAENGIYTAADIDRDVITYIKGFGGSGSRLDKLLKWRAEQEGLFVFDPKVDVSPAEIRALNLRFRSQQKQLLSDLERHLAHLESLKPACHSAIELLKPKLKAAVETREQAFADMKLLSA